MTGFLRGTVLLLLLLVTTRTAAQQQPAQDLTERDRTHLARLLAMTDQRIMDTTLVDSALTSSSALVRAAGTLAIGQVGPANAAPRVARLRAVLADPDPAVAARAAYALGLLRDSASVESLVASLGSTPAVAAEAAWALGQIGEPARAAIVRHVESLPADTAVAIQFLLAAAKLSPVPAVAVLPHLHAADPSIVWAAAYAIARPRVSAGARALIELEHSPAARDLSPGQPGSGVAPSRMSQQNMSHRWYVLGDSSPPRIRAEIARGLPASVAGDTLAEAALATLARLAGDAHPHVRINALRSIATYGDRGHALLTSALGDGNAHVRSVATEALDTTRRALPPQPPEERRDTVATPRDEAWYRAVVADIVVPGLHRRNPVAVLHTERGAIELEMLGADAPLTVYNFLTLARRGYYDGLVFHRVVPNFVIQDGDPRGDGMGGPGYSIRDELNPWRYERGILGMALSGPDTGGSQYFITHSPQPHLDGGYTVFGRVRSGWDALDSIVQGDRIIRVEVR